jgi:CubicO group peptidase (beta-lactamase class C family)
MGDVDLEGVGRAADVLFEPGAAHGASLALVVQRDGVVEFERYGRQPDTAFGPGHAVTADSTLISWSMAKSITHAAVGILVGEGLLDPHAPAPVAAWKGTPKGAITLQHLLEMRPGLAFVEDYVDDSVSNCIEMLYGAGADDMAAYAAALPLVHEPGSVWNYSSGTTNIIARIVGDAVGDMAGQGHERTERFLVERLFRPAGMQSAIPKFDTAGTFVGSSYVYATARDFALFGELYRNDGVAAGGVRVLPAGWAAHAAATHSHDPETGFGYGAQWWSWPQFPGSISCHGYEGQYTLVVPDRKLVVVHLGKVPAAQRHLVAAQLQAIVEAVPA